MNRLVLAVTGLLAIAGLGLFAAARPAHANGVPQLVKLTYLNGVSNWGPKDAEGVLEFSFAEAYARVDVKNLKPQAGFSYEGWLTGGAGEPLRVGQVPVSDAGVGVLEAKLKDLKRYDYDTFILAARGPAAPASGIPSEKSIAGRFTVIKDNGTPKAGDVNGGGRPASLPETGQEPNDGLRERLGRTFMVVLVAAGVAIVAVRLVRRGKPR